MPPPSARVIAGQLRLAAGYLRDSRILSAAGSRSAVNLLFQAAEAALIAVMTAEGIHAGRAHQHQLAAMTDTLPEVNPLKPLFRDVEHLTGYATTFRYVMPSGGIKGGPSPADLDLWQSKVQHIIELCRDWFGVDVDMSSTSAAAKVEPMRTPEQDL